MKIGNIVSTHKLEVSEDFNVVKTMDDIIHGLPTLILGYDYVCKHYPDFDILEPQLAENLYWTFKRTEKRDKFEEDLSWFIAKTYADLTKDLSYVFLDPIQYKTRTLLKIVRKIYSLPYKISYLHGDMVYIYGDKYIFGIDLKLLAYLGMKIDKIKTKIIDISNVFLTRDQILIEYKKTISALENKVRFIPYLYSIRHDQNDNSSILHIPRETGMVS